MNEAGASGPHRRRWRWDMALWRSFIEELGSFHQRSARASLLPGLAGQPWQPELERRVRRRGGGRRSKVAEDPQLLGALEALVEPTTRGNPESPLRWTLAAVCVSWQRH